MHPRKGVHSHTEADGSPPHTFIDAHVCPVEREGLGGGRGLERVPPNLHRVCACVRVCTRVCDCVCVRPIPSGPAPSQFACMHSCSMHAPPLQTHMADGPIGRVYAVLHTSWLAVMGPLCVFCSSYPTRVWRTQFVWNFSKLV